MPPERLEQVMRAGALEVREVEPIGAGITGALRMQAYYPAADRVLTTKWKGAPEGDGWNNSPRREIASYLVQKWFLDPVDYVVPTTLALCLPLHELPDAEPAAFRGARCVFGTQAIWLEDVETPEVLLDTGRFYRDATYARHVANYNLLTYLIENRDTRAGNYLTSRDETNRRAYSIDNGLTFGAWPYNFFASHWDRIRVPALPRRSIERLRRVGAGDLEALAVVAELHLYEDGVLRNETPSAPFEAERGVRIRDGVLQLGLEPDEIDGVRERLRDLLRGVDAGRIAVF